MENTLLSPRLKKQPPAPMNGEDPLAQRLRRNGPSSPLLSQERTTTSEPVAVPGSVDGLGLGGQEEEVSKLSSRYKAGDSALEDKKKTREVEKKYRTKGEKEAEALRFERFASSFELLAQVSSEMLCAQLPNPVPPKPLEVELLNKALSGVAQKHFDSLLDYDAEATLLIVALSIILPRLKVPKTEAEKAVEAVRATKDVLVVDLGEKKLEEVPLAS